MFLGDSLIKMLECLNANFVGTPKFLQSTQFVIVQCYIFIVCNYNSKCEFFFLCSRFRLEKTKNDVHA